MRKKETMATERMRGKKKKEEAAERMREKKKRNPEEREIIDKISSCYNILIQEIQLLMYSSSSYLMSYCSLAKKKKSFRESVGAWTVDILSIFSPYFAYAYAVGDALIYLSMKKLMEANLDTDTSGFDCHSPWYSH